MAIADGFAAQDVSREAIGEERPGHGQARDDLPLGAVAGIAAYLDTDAAAAQIVDEPGRDAEVERVGRCPMPVRITDTVFQQWRSTAWEARRLLRDANEIQEESDADEDWFLTWKPASHALGQSRSLSSAVS
jgi:hypothetical protein